MSKKNEPFEQLNDESSLDQFIANHNICFVEVYSSTWDRCQALVSTARRWKAQYLSNGVVFGLIEASAASKLGPVGAAPRFFLFHKGSLVSDFTGLNIPLLQSSIEQLFV
ncbi:hypothetical protein GEMRC1_007446 [Eukaryota sp. GEM-RC1]